MLARLLDYGPRALAQAKYGTDFLPTRDRSLGTGSLYVYKKLPEDDDGGRYGQKARLWSYMAVVFGEIDEVMSLDSSAETYLCLKCPSKATCEVSRLFDNQWKVLQDVLDKEEADMGGRSTVTWFDCARINAVLEAVPSQFYVMGDTTPGMKRRLKKGLEVTMKVWLQRHDTRSEADGVLNRAYTLDLMTFDIHKGELMPRRLDSYVCDINGRIGCDSCTEPGGR
ncbi:hypothetical protein FB451DRAFT_1182347 [Mycena latifolia]|nr:hypothetical protein FB451DRAFT_1182347 [Mycena latifolia]